jgi:hypothetical protein
MSLQASSRADRRQSVRHVEVGDADAGERDAIIYSIIERCRHHGIEPYTICTMY